MWRLYSFIFTLSLSITLFCLNLISFQSLPIPGPGNKGLVGTWTQIQKKFANSCSTVSNTCSVTITSTGSGHVGVVMWTTGTTSAIASSINGGTWTIPAACQQSNATVNGTIGCAYALVGNLSSGTTTLTVTWNTSNPQAGTSFEFYELNWSGSSVALDSGTSGGLGKVNDTSASTSLSGAALTLAGLNDTICQGLEAQSGHPTSINNSYVLDSDGTTDFFGYAHLLNTSNGSAPTWTNSASGQAIGSAIALSGT